MPVWKCHIWKFGGHCYKGNLSLELQSKCKKKKNRALKGGSTAQWVSIKAQGSNGPVLEPCLYHRYQLCEHATLLYFSES